jgi:endonuclease YncB( thermonuclease family)
VDGDTVWLNGDKIRIEDIDAPEVSRPRCLAEKALGERATARLQQLLEGAAITIAQTGDRAVDPYGRELRTISIDGKSVGQILVSDGLAHEWVGHKLPWCGSTTDGFDSSR